MTHVVEVETLQGPARWHVDEPVGRVIANLALGHGAGGGVESPDLRLVAQTMSAAGVRVGRFEQPWRIAGRRVAGPPSSLDAAWCAALPAFVVTSLPLVVGGRSAGARVACRTGVAAAAEGVLALGFPLHPPRKPDKSRVDELPRLPVLVVQGDRDALGTAAEVTRSASVLPHVRVLTVPGADHSLRVAKRGPITQVEADEVIAIEVRRWILSIVRGNHR